MAENYHNGTSPHHPNGLDQDGLDRMDRPDRDNLEVRDELEVRDNHEVKEVREVQEEQEDQSVRLDRGATPAGARPQPGAAQIQAWLVGKLAAELGIAPDELDVAEPFASYGLGSTELVGLSGELAQWLGRQLPAELAYACPTIEALARHLAEPADAPPAATGSEPAETATADAIAIIGIGCRFPGADGADEFWQLLRDGTDAIREVPAERFDVNEFYDADPAAPGKMVTRWGGFIDQVDQFDAHFFGISPREAARMDPQQRLLLEVAAQALEDAGQLRERLAGTPVAVFIGISNNDYGRLQLNDFKRIDAYAGTGNALSIAANRISYVFDFHGPSMAIDTACSSSLVAVHEACRSLRAGESTLALAGGVNLILSPAITINFSKAGAMAPDGRCKTFDARANGYVRGEGAGIVVLKPLARALCDGDPVYAVICGSAVNQDGRSNGLMAPNPRAQEAVLREAYRQAAVAPADVQYVEAHGTGTLLGDPIEARALGAVLGAERADGAACTVGSVKTNFGHLEAAAGIAGLIKVALALKHREIPPSLNFTEPNPHIPFAELRLRVQTTLTPWPAGPTPASAGVSSFGFGGTNAHVVMQAAPAATALATPRESAPDEPGVAARAYLLPLSARSPEALRALATAWHDRMTAGADNAASLHDLCYSASLHRNHYEYRLAVTGSSGAQIADSLDAFLRGETRSGLVCGQRNSDRRRKLVFVFPGQGSQWFGMGRALLGAEPVFRDAVERCDRAMRPYGDWSLIAELTATDAAGSRLHEIDVLQPALFALQVALAALWRSWGITPDAVVGHSMGEVAAAVCAGALSLDDAARVICSRSRLVKPTIGRGAMAAVELPLDQLGPVMAGFEQRVSVAASNSHAATVLSGEPAALDAIVDRLRQQNIFCRTLKVDFAAHSPQMEPLRDDLMRALDGLDPRPPTIPLYSTVTGGPVVKNGPVVKDRPSDAGGRGVKNGSNGASATGVIGRSDVTDGSGFAGGPEFDGAYWARNLREPVLFAAAIDRLLDDGHDIFLEISAHPILLSSIAQGLDHAGKSGITLPSTRRDEDERSAMLASLGALYACGQPVDWHRLYPDGGRRVRLPFYPWQRERCWLEGAGIANDHADARPATAGTGAHPLLGRHFKSPHPAQTEFWEVTLDRATHPYLDDHRVAGATVIPAALYLEMALAAAFEAFGSDAVGLDDIEFHRALFLPDGATTTLQLILTVGADGQASFHIYSRAEAPRAGESAPPDTRWTLHASGNVARASIAQAALTDDALTPEIPDEIRRRCPMQITGPDYYLRLRENGVDYGPNFQSLADLWRRDSEVIGELSRPASAVVAGTPPPPALLDACIQVVGAALPGQTAPDQAAALYMPTRIDRLRLDGGVGGPKLNAGTPRWTHVRLRDADSIVADGTMADALVADVRILDDSGHPTVEISGLRLQNLAHEDASAAAGAGRLDEWLYELQWRLDERDRRESAPRDYRDSAAGEHRGSAPEAAAAAAPGNIMVFADNRGVGAAIAALVNQGGADGDSDRAIIVTHGDSYERLDETHYRIHPGRPDDLRRMLAEVTAPGQPALRTAVHLWSLDDGLPPSATVAALAEAQALGCESVLEVVRELAGADRNSPRLWLVTRGVQAAGTESLAVDPGHAPLWGLGRVLAAEHPLLWGGLIDLEPDAPAAGDSASDRVAAAKGDASDQTPADALDGVPLASAADRDQRVACQIFNEINAPDGEDQIALRQGRRYVGRLLRYPRADASHATRWHADGTYLITGGLGDLGLSIARWMVTQGARRLILMGRTQLPARTEWNSVAADSPLARQIAAIRALEAAGASVHLAAVDVADEPSLTAWLATFGAEGWPPIRGVVHAAGVLHDAMLAQLDNAALTAVMRPKVLGAWLLHRMLEKAPLDFFVMCSSAGALLGQPGQGGYAAANAFLDALAHHRAALGRPALSINWGAWAAMGFAESTGGKRLAQRLALIGISSLAPAEALAVLGRLLGQRSSQVAAVPVDWSRYREFYPAGSGSPLLSELGLEAAGNATPAGAGAGERRAAILAAGPAGGRLLLRAHLAELVARVLGLSAAKLDLDQPLSNLGLDSLMAVELKNRIAGDLGVNVPMVTFLSGPSVDQATDQLLHLMTTETSIASIVSGAAAPDGAGGDQNDDLPEDLDQYSDAEVDSLLADLMEKEAPGQ